MFPYLDVLGFRKRSRMAAAEIDYVETSEPGYLVQQIASQSSWINGRLRKRYGNAPGTNFRGVHNNPYGHNPQGNSLPFGQIPPTVLGSGTAPPLLALAGRPTLGSIQLQIFVVAPGSLGTATIKYSLDGGVTFTTVATALSIILIGSGMTLQTPAGSIFSADNQYTAATPVPEIVLGWLVTLVTEGMYVKRGANADDPSLEWLREDVKTVKAEVQEAANQETGLFDIPVTEDGDSAVTSSGPLGSSDASPYAWQDRQVHTGPRQDCWRGGYGGRIL